MCSLLSYVSVNLYISAFVYGSVQAFGPAADLMRRNNMVAIALWQTKHSMQGRSVYCRQECLP